MNVPDPVVDILSVIEPAMALPDSQAPFSGIVAAISPESREIYHKLEKKYGKKNLDNLVDLLGEVFG